MWIVCVYLAEILLDLLALVAMNEFSRSPFLEWVTYNYEPLKLKSVPRLNPRTGIDGRILLTTIVKDPHMVDKLLAACQTYLDPTEY